MSIRGRSTRRSQGHRLSPSGPARPEERGVTLIECLVAAAILSIMAVGIAAATGTAATGSAAINQTERTDVLLSAFSEAIQNLPYQPCETPDVTTDPSATSSSTTASQYQQDFLASQSALPPAQRIAQTNGSYSIVLVVTAVSLPTAVATTTTTSPGSTTTTPAPAGMVPCSVGADLGLESLSLTVCTLQSAAVTTTTLASSITGCSGASSLRRSSGTVVKRSSAAVGLKARVILSGGAGHQYPAVGYGPNLTSSTYAPVQTWAASGVGSWSPNGIYAYQYTCINDSERPSASDYLVTTVLKYGSDDLAECDFAAGIPGSGNHSDAHGTYHTATIELDVIDESQPTPIITKSAPVAVPVYDLLSPPAALDASFTMSTTSTIVGQSVTFTPTSTDPTFTSWVWDFGDTTYTGTAGELVCTGTYAQCSSASHVYIATGTGSFTVKLTVLNAAGQQSSSTQVIAVAQAPVPAPFPSFTLTPTAGVAPQTVKADASASKDSSGNPITDGNFTWQVTNTAGVVVNFGLGNHASVSFKPTDAGTYTVQLTVKGANGAIATVSHPVVLTALVAPTNVHVSNATAHLFGSTSVTISWTDAPRTWKDTAQTIQLDQKDEYNIRITNTDSSCGFGILDLNNSSGSFVTAASTAPFVQSYTWTIPGSFSGFARGLFCSGTTYQVTIQTIRVDSDGVQWTSTASSAPVSFKFAVSA